MNNGTPKFCGRIDPCEQWEHAEMGHGHPESEEYSQSVKDRKAAMRFESLRSGFANHRIARVSQWPRDRQRSQQSDLAIQPVREILAYIGVMQQHANPFIGRLDLWVLG